MDYPDELTPALREVLGLLNFQTGPIAHIYRAAGHAIPKRCEDEQAFVLHRCIRAAIEHGDDWRDHMQADLDTAKAAIRERSVTEPAKENPQ